MVDHIEFCKQDILACIACGICLGPRQLLHRQHESLASRLFATNYLIKFRILQLAKYAAYNMIPYPLLQWPLPTFCCPHLCSWLSGTALSIPLQMVFSSALGLQVSQLGLGVPGGKIGEACQAAQSRGQFIQLGNLHQHHHFSNARSFLCWPCHCHVLSSL